MLTKPIRGTLLNKSHPLSRGLVGCWLMNENCGGFVSDLSGNNKKGTFNGGSIWAIEITGNVVNLIEGSSSYISMLPFNLSEFTVIAKIYPRSWNVIDAFFRENRISAIYYCFELVYYESKTRIYIYDGGDYLAETDPPTLNQWNVVAGTYDGYNLTAYLNGVAGTPATHSGINTTGIHAYIGNVANSEYFDGLIDHVMVWNRALTADEINMLYRNPFCIVEDLEFDASGDYGGVTYQLSATIPATFGVSGNLSSDQALTVTVPATFGINADLSSKKSISATIPATFGINADLSTKLNLSATIPATFGISADIDLAGPVTKYMEATIASTFGINANLSSSADEDLTKVTGRARGSYTTGKCITKRRVKI